jgi:hypothetical protein
METADLAKEVSPRTRGLFLKNLSDFQTELARVQAGFVPSLAVWAQRKELPGLIFRSMRRVQDLRIRGRELGVSFAEMHLSNAVAGRELLAVLCAAPSAASFIQTALIAAPKILVEAIHDYLKRNDPLYDLPSVALLEADRDELLAQIQWGEAALVVLAKDGLQPDAGFAARVAAQLPALPSALREHTAKNIAAVTQGRKIGALPLPDSILPQGFTYLEFGPTPVSPGSPYVDRARYRAINFLQEVQAADSCASLLFDTPDMPWDFYFDLSRHMWDEARHSMFGEKKLIDVGSTAAAAGLSSKAYAMRQTLTPHDRYAALTTQEADAFPGKHAGLKDAVANHDSVSAMAWSYDIADETQHVRFGTKWLPVLIEKAGDPRSHEQVKADSCNWRESVLAAVYKPAAATMKSR